MQVRDLVRFSKERCFNGAVQTEWFYDSNRVEAVAESYIFHGPKYFGVSESDVGFSEHKLIDTASFTLNLAEKLNDKKPSNSFVMTIAGYGAGKSHLAVSLAALFSGKQNIADIVIENIEKADEAIADRVKSINKKKNFVIVLNGMNNFNLDAEVLRCTRLVLEQNDLNDDVLKKLTKSYDIARKFVENTFSPFQKQFEEEAAKRGIKLQDEELKKFILDKIESDNKILELVNTVYRKMTGDTIRWDRGLSAGDIISAIHKHFCGYNKPFNKVLILFDEFGRYIEYAAANPAIAGEAALQQIFESVQSADGGIIFAGFVQSELDAYLARIEKTSNIMRYVGRYKASENLFLSSNFETILASLLQKVNIEVHERILESSFKRYKSYQSFVERSILRWDRNAEKKSVWANSRLYKSVIMKGCYPLHPITVCLLSNMNNWLQQRSSITFAAEMVERISDAEIENGWLPYVYPINIIDSSIYKEMLNSEEKGLVQSQYCMLYRDILVKIGDKLSDIEAKALKAILIINIGHFSFDTKEDAFAALKYCSALEDKELSMALDSLENMHGVISYDENANTFDLFAEANGYNEFKRVFNRYRMLTKPAVIEDLDDSVREILQLTEDIETSFAQSHHISSLEWKYKKTLMDVSDISEAVISSKLIELDNDISGDGNRGELIFAYCAKNSEREIKRVAGISKKLSLSKTPLIIIFLDDGEGEIIKTLTEKAVLDRFSNADNERFQKHIEAQRATENKKIAKKFNSLVQARNCITEKGLVQYSGRLNTLCTARFEEVYNSVLPFMFDGFESKRPAAAKRYLSNICTKMFDRTLMNIQSYNALSTDEKNRVKACLTVGSNTSWQVYTPTCEFIKPLEVNALKVFDTIDNSLGDTNLVDIMQIFGKFAKAPYGMNMNAIALFAFYYMAFKDKYILCYFGDTRIRPADISDRIFKGNKLQIKEFSKLRIRNNPYVDIDLVRDLCNEIMSCTLVENCQKYKLRLNELLQQEGADPANMILVASANTRLDEGIELRENIYEKLENGQELVAEAKKNFNILKLIRVFSYYVDTSEAIKPGLPFVYSDEYKKQMADLKKKADTLFRTKGEEGISALSCKITQLSQFKIRTQNMIASFQANGYEDLAKLAEARTAYVEEELLARKKYEKSIVELDQDIAMMADTSRMGYASCFSALEKMKGWERFFAKLKDMPTRLLNAQEEKVSKAIKLLTARMNKISDACHTLISGVEKASSDEEISRIEDKLNSMISMGLNEDDMAAANECLRYIALAKDKMAEFPDSIDELQELSDTLNVKEFGCCATYITKALKNRLENLRNDQNNWVSRFIKPAIEGYSNMSVVDCSNWLDRTQTLPVYLDKNVLSKYKKAKEKVEKQLHKNRVLGVFVMYDKLSEEEKMEFKGMINS